MECRTIVGDKDIHLCPILMAAIDAGLIVGVEGILLFDRDSRTFFLHQNLISNHPEINRRDGLLQSIRGK